MPTTRPVPAPPGVWYVATSLAQAQGWSAAVDAALGYPKPGVEVGGGVHVKDLGGGPFVTQTYGQIIAHPNGTQWAYWSDANAASALVGVQNLPVPVALDVTWVGGTVQAGPGLAKALLSRRTLAAAGIALAMGGIVAGAAMLPSQPAAMQLDAGAIDSSAEASE